MELIGPEFFTRSIMLAAALRLAGFDPARTVRDDGRLTAYYAITPALTAAVAAYNDGTMVVPAKHYAKAVHEVKQAFLPR